MRELEPAEDVGSPASALRTGEGYLEITHPLPGAVFSRDPLSPDSAQAIALRYATDMEYDSIVRLYDGRPMGSDELPVEPGEHEATIRLILRGRTVAERTVRYSVRIDERR